MAKPFQFPREALVAELRAHAFDLAACAAAAGVPRKTYMQRLERQGLNAAARTLLRHGVGPSPAPAAAPPVTEAAYADAAMTVRALTEACTALAAEVLALEDALAHERTITARLAALIEDMGTRMECAA